MKIDFKINLNVAIRWELLADRPFFSLDYSNEEDVLRLCYCAAIEADPSMQSTFETYRKTFDASPKVAKATMRAVSSYNRWATQFNANKITLSADATTGDEEPERIERVVAYLVVRGGMDPNYVLRDMPIEYVRIFMEGIAEQTRQELENQRLWTWLTIKPHVDKNALRTPDQLYRFPWEAERVSARAVSDLKHLRATEKDFAEKLKSVKWNTKK